MDETTLDLTKPVQTRSGLPARIITTINKGKDVVYVVTEEDGLEFVMASDSFGKLCSEIEDEWDLVNTPVYREIYIQVYEDLNGNLAPFNYLDTPDAKSSVPTPAIVGRIKVKLVKGQWDD